MTDGGGAMGPYAFSPNNPAPIKVGTTVTWINSGSTTHTTTSDATPPIWDQTLTPAGNPICDIYGCHPGTPAGSYQRTFMAAGTYQYHCTIHGGQGMTGTITVTP